MSATKQVRRSANSFLEIKFLPNVEIRMSLIRVLKKSLHMESKTLIEFNYSSIHNYSSIQF